MVSLDDAEEFLWLNARLIDRLRFEHLFRGGDPTRVVTALRPYRNPDGGFGNALEPDLRGPHSQPVPVDLALFLLDEAGALGSDTTGSDLVRGILDYLSSITRPDGGVPFVLPSALRSPHAPWWQVEERLPGALNPTGSLLGHLHKNGVRDAWIDRATAFCWRGIEALTQTSPYEVRAVLFFLERVPDRERAEQAWRTFGPMILAGGHVALDPQADGEVTSPLAVAPRPASLARSLFSAEVIDSHLDALAAAQQPDGGWGFTFASWTPITTPEWRGWATIEALVTLRDNGRL